MHSVPLCLDDSCDLRREVILSGAIGPLRRPHVQENASFPCFSYRPSGRATHDQRRSVYKPAGLDRGNFSIVG